MYLFGSCISIKLLHVLYICTNISIYVCVCEMWRWNGWGVFIITFTGERNYVCWNDWCRYIMHVVWTVKIKWPRDALASVWHSGGPWFSPGLTWAQSCTFSANLAGGSGLECLIPWMGINSMSDLCASGCAQKKIPSCWKLVPLPWWYLLQSPLYCSC